VSSISWGQMGKDMTTKRFFNDLYQEIQEDNVFTGAAALAYYWMLSIFPFAIFLLSLLPYLPIANLREAIMELLQQALPGEAAEVFTGVVDDVVSDTRGGLLSFGLLFTLWAGSNGLYAIMQQLNITYGVKEGRSFWRARLVALMLMVMFLVLIIGAFALVVFGGQIQDWVASYIGWSGALLTFFAVFRWVVISVLILLGFALIYYYGPNVEQDFRFITPGSLIGALLLIGASLGFSYYVSNFGDYSAMYGSLGAVIILLLWLYIAGLVILFGSEVNSLLEHYNPGGKEEGEKREGEKAEEGGKRSAR
jgi:membrane protein